jgi:hypothetical protein
MLSTSLSAAMVATALAFSALAADDPLPEDDTPIANDDTPIAMMRKMLNADESTASGSTEDPKSDATPPAPGVEVPETDAPAPDKPELTPEKKD